MEAILVGAVALVVAAVTFTVMRRRRLESRPLEELSKGELYQRAQKADVPGRSQMTKDQLIEALREGAH